MRVLPIALAASAAVVAATVAPSARAAGGNRDSFEVSVDVKTLWMREMPTYGVTQSHDTNLRRIGTGTLPSSGSQAFLGFTLLDMAYISSDRWKFPLFGITFLGAVGPSPRVVTSLDGSIVEMHPWTTFGMDLLLPGIGRRFKERRWMFAATLRPVVSFYWTNVVVSQGPTAVDLNDGKDGSQSVWTAVFGLRADLEACRRMDPTNRACLFVAPNVYQSKWLNGGSVGLRWEWGS